MDTPTDQSQNRLEIKGGSRFLGYGAIAERGFSLVQRDSKDYPSTVNKQDASKTEPTHLCEVATLLRRPLPF